MLDKKELLILLELRKNSRQSLAEISRKTNIPVSTIFDKIIKLNKIIIRKRITLLDFNKMGYTIKAHLILKCKKERELKESLLVENNVNSVYRINNGSNFLIECFFKSMFELELFKERLADFGVEGLKEHHIVEEIKKEEFLTKREYLRLIDIQKLDLDQ